MSYEIVTRRDRWSSDAAGWSAEGMGGERENTFETESEACAAIAELRDLGPEWVEARYAVREKGEWHIEYEAAS